MLTPYQFASNTPIGAIDLDGLEHSEYFKLMRDDDEAFAKTHTAEEVANRNKIQTAIWAAPFGAWAIAEGAAYVSANWVYLLYNPMAYNEVGAVVYGSIADDEWPVPAVGDDISRTVRNATKLAFEFPKIARSGSLRSRWIKSFGELPEHLEVHHIIPAALENHKVFKQSGLDIDDLYNGIPLPKYSPKRGLEEGVHATHPAYNEFVKQQLDEIGELGPLSQKAIQEEISKLRNDLIQLIEQAGNEGETVNEFFKGLNKE